MLPLKAIAFSKNAMRMLKKNNEEDSECKKARQECLMNRIQDKNA